MSSAVKDVRLQPTLMDEAAPATGLAPVNADVVSLFERLATDPNASVEKIERLMALWERGETKKAEAAFNAAMSAAQKEMRPVAADAFNPQTRSKYASYEALDRELRPIYTDHGFGLSFNTGDCPLPEHVRVLCEATHSGGFAKVYTLDMPADGKGAKGGDVMTKTHAAGSALSYGMRYLLKMIFNIAVGEGDDDGNKAGRRNEPEPPSKFNDWWADMQAVADNGLAPLQAAWKDAKADFRKFTADHRKREWEALKAKAQKAKAS
jgi:hypothetical protein